MTAADRESAEPNRFDLRRKLAALVLFGISFGYVEAAVVVYLRALYDPLRLELYPALEPGALFPLIRLDQFQALGPQYERQLVTELIREAATLVMLAAAGLAAGRTFCQWVAGFVIAFGVWDIFYYVFLYLLIDWPSSLLTWDLLFLLPVPWVGPVLAPVLVSLSLIGGGVVVLWCESIGRPVQTSWRHWSTFIAAALVIVAAFCWDFHNTAAGGLPNPFNWPLFAVGEVLGLAGLVCVLRTSR